MKKISIAVALIVLFGMTSFAQDEGATKKENKNQSLLGYFMANESRPVYNIYAGDVIIDNQSCITPPAKSLEFVIQHRFGTMDNGISDLYGIFGAANTRLGMNYSITNWLQIGFGTAKINKIQDFGLKINLLQQSRDNKVPVSVTYYGNMAIDARADKNFGINYKFGNRFSYFNELMVTRKFCDWFTLTVGGSFTHFNQVDSLMEHDKIALHFLGRFKLTEQSSIVIDYDWPLKINGITEWPGDMQDPPKPNLGIGWEIATVTHVFQVFVGTSTFMVPQYNVMMNQNDWTKGDLYIGFNISRMWSF